MNVLYAIGEEIKKSLKIKSGFNFAFLFYPCGMEREMSDYVSCLNEYDVEVIAISGGGVINNVIPFIYDNIPVGILTHINREGVYITDIGNLKNDTLLFKLDECSALIFSNESVDLDEIANILKNKGVTQVMGGVAGSYVKEKHKPRVFYNQDEMSNVILLFNNNLFDVSGKSVLGWKPIGIPSIVTEAVKDTIYSIDDIPALEYVEKFLGSDIDKYIEQFLFSFALYRSDADYVLAAIKSIDKSNKSIKVFHRKVPVGTRISLAIPDNINNFIKEEISAFDYGQITNNVILICVACIGRRAYLSDIYPFVLFKVTHSMDISFSGFFSNGEYNKVAYSKDFSYLNLTTSTIFIKEKRNVR